MSATSAFPLATETAYAGGDPGGVAGSDDTGGDTGAAGPSSDGGAYLSTGALAAILVIVCLVAVFGAIMAALFFVAKKREWTIRETLRRSARKVVTALTPRSRSEFPRELKDEVPPTPRIRKEDLEKGLVLAQSKHVEESARKKSRWARG